MKHPGFRRILKLPPVRCWLRRIWRFHLLQIPLFHYKQFDIDVWDWSHEYLKFCIWGFRPNNKLEESKNTYMCLNICNCPKKFCNPSVDWFAQGFLFWRRWPYIPWCLRRLRFCRCYFWLSCWTLQLLRLILNHPRRRLWFFIFGKLSCHFSIKYFYWSCCRWLNFWETCRRFFFDFGLWVVVFFGTFKASIWWW